MVHEFYFQVVEVSVNEVLAMRKFVAPELVFGVGSSKLAGAIC